MARKLPFKQSGQMARALNVFLMEVGQQVIRAALTSKYMAIIANHARRMVKARSLVMTAAQIKIF
jgi:hypothetical protein